MNTMRAPCGLTHHDEPPSDASRWCAHWAAHGARVLSGDDVDHLRKERAPKDNFVTINVTIKNTTTGAETDLIGNHILLDDNQIDWRRGGCEKQCDAETDRCIANLRNLVNSEDALVASIAKNMIRAHAERQAGQEGLAHCNGITARSAAVEALIGFQAPVLYEEWR